MKIRQIIKEYEVPDVVDATDTYAPPSKGYAIRVHGPLGSPRSNQTPAAALWYGLSEVFPRDYPPANFQNIGQQMASPQARVLNTIRREGSAVVKSGIASRDLAETLANKLGNYGPPPPPDEHAGKIPMSQIQVISQDLNEAYDPGLSSKLIAAGTKVAQQIFVRYAWDSSQFRTMLEHEYNISAGELMNWQISLNADEIIKWMNSKGSELHYDKSNPIEFEVTIPGSAPYNFNIAKVLKGTNESLDEAARPPIAPDPQNYNSDWDYYNDRDADDMTDSDPADDMTDDEPDDWFDESKEKVGNMDADAFDAALSRMKKLAGAGPLRTVYDPARRVYKNVPHSVQPAQQPKKAR